MTTYMYRNLLSTILCQQFHDLNKPFSFRNGSVIVHYDMFFGLNREEMPSSKTLLDVLYSVERDEEDATLGVLGELRFRIDSPRIIDTSKVDSNQLYVNYTSIGRSDVLFNLDKQEGVADVISTQLPERGSGVHEETTPDSQLSTTADNHAFQEIETVVPTTKSSIPTSVNTTTVNAVSTTSELPQLETKFNLIFPVELELQKTTNNRSNSRHIHGLNKSYMEAKSEIKFPDSWQPQTNPLGKDFPTNDIEHSTIAGVIPDSQRKHNDLFTTDKPFVNDSFNVTHSNQTHATSQNSFKNISVIFNDTVNVQTLYRADSLLNSPSEAGVTETTELSPLVDEAIEVAKADVTVDGIPLNLTLSKQQSNDSANDTYSSSYQDDIWGRNMSIQTLRPVASIIDTTTLPSKFMHDKLPVLEMYSPNDRNSSNQSVILHAETGSVNTLIQSDTEVVLQQFNDTEFHMGLNFTGVENQEPGNATEDKANISEIEFPATPSDFNGNNKSLFDANDLTVFPTSMMSTDMQQNVTAVNTTDYPNTTGGQFINTSTDYYFYDVTIFYENSTSIESLTTNSTFRYNGHNNTNMSYTDLTTTASTASSLPQENNFEIRDKNVSNELTFPLSHKDGIVPVNRWKMQQLSSAKQPGLEQNSNNTKAVFIHNITLRTVSEDSELNRNNPLKRNGGTTIDPDINYLLPNDTDSVVSLASENPRVLLEREHITRHVSSKDIQRPETAHIKGSERNAILGAGDTEMSTLNRFTLITDHIPQNSNNIVYRKGNLTVSERNVKQIRHMGTAVGENIVDKSINSTASLINFKSGGSNRIKTDSLSVASGENTLTDSASNEANLSPTRPVNSGKHSSDLPTRFTAINSFVNTSSVVRNRQDTLTKRLNSNDALKQTELEDKTFFDDKNRLTDRANEIREFNRWSSVLYFTPFSERPVLGSLDNQLNDSLSDSDLTSENITQEINMTTGRALENTTAANNRNDNLNTIYLKSIRVSNSTIQMNRNASFEISFKANNSTEDNSIQVSTSPTTASDKTVIVSKFITSSEEDISAEDAARIRTSTHVTKRFNTVQFPDHNVTIMTPQTVSHVTVDTNIAEDDISLTTHASNNVSVGVLETSILRSHNTTSDSRNSLFHLATEAVPSADEQHGITRTVLSRHFFSDETVTSDAVSFRTTTPTPKILSLTHHNITIPVPLNTVDKVSNDNYSKRTSPVFDNDLSSFQKTTLKQTKIFDDSSTFESQSAESTSTEIDILTYLYGHVTTLPTILSAYSKDFDIATPQSLSSLFFNTSTLNTLPNNDTSTAYSDVSEMKSSSDKLLLYSTVQTTDAPSNETFTIIPGTLVNMSAKSEWTSTKHEMGNSTSSTTSFLDSKIISGTKILSETPRSRNFSSSSKKDETSVVKPKLETVTHNALIGINLFKGKFNPLSPWLPNSNLFDTGAHTDKPKARQRMLYTTPSTLKSSTTLKPGFNYLWSLGGDVLSGLFSGGNRVKQPDAEWGGGSFSDLNNTFASQNRQTGSKFKSLQEKHIEPKEAFDAFDNLNMHGVPVQGISIQANPPMLMRTPGTDSDVAQATPHNVSSFVPQNRSEHMARASKSKTETS